MNQTRKFFGLLAIATLLVVSAHSAVETSELTVLEGKWKGKEIGNSSNEGCHLIITGKKIEYRGLNSSDWIKGTFELKPDAKPARFVAKITDCENADLIGKTTVVIYKLENGMLTIAGKAPGSTTAPDGFDDADARKFEFKKE